MVPPREVVIDSDDPSDHSQTSRAFWAEEVTIQNWIDAGAPDPLAMWEQLEAATDQPTPLTAPKLGTPSDVRAQGLASIEDAPAPSSAASPVTPSTGTSVATSP